MTESVPLKQIRDKVAAYDKGLLANDPRFRRSVTLIHEDGSIVHYDSAFLMKIKDESKVPWLTDEAERYWIICFTEHHGLHIDHSDELLRYWESEKRHQAVEEFV